MSECQKPNCRTSSSETYSDEHGNTLDLCETCYYELVSGKTVRSQDLSIPNGIGTDPIRRQDSASTDLRDELGPTVDVEIETVDSDGDYSNKYRATVDTESSGSGHLSESYK